MSHQTNTTAIVRRQSLTASVCKACTQCGAPGVFQNSLSFVEKYPEIYRPAWAGKDVGPTCPCCGTPRGEEKQLGEIWSKEWAGSVTETTRSFRRLVEKVKGLIKH